MQFTNCDKKDKHHELQGNLETGTHWRAIILQITQIKNLRLYYLTAEKLVQTKLLSLCNKIHLTVYTS